jgi:hypothetical protein
VEISGSILPFLLILPHALRIIGYQVSGVSAVVGKKSGRSNRKRNFQKANNEYRTRNNESSSGGQVSK